MIPFNFAIPFNYSKIRTPQGLHPTVRSDSGMAEINNWIKRKRASEVSIWPRKPLFYAFFGGFDPGEGFFYCIKVSRNIEPQNCTVMLLIYTFTLFLWTITLFPIQSDFPSQGGSFGNRKNIWFSPESKKVLAARGSFWTPCCQNSLIYKAFLIGKE